MLSDSFTHVIVNFVTGKRVFVGTLAGCEAMLTTNHRLICVRRSLH